MADPNADATDQPAFKGPEAPCVYCGKVIDRGADRCPHCRTSYSLAVRKASREVVGDWFYLDPRNPSGRGVTFETLIKMIEKGRIKPDSIVRGPTTHHDWVYAAEAPRLAKYLGMCPHCFAEAKPEDTYCTHCQLNMNERPAEARPGATPDDVQDPYHKAAYEVEERLAEAAKAEEEPPTPAPRPAPAAAPRPAAAPGPGPRPEPKPSAMATAAAQALAGSGAGERPSRVAATPQRSGPKLWIVLVLTWVTLIPILLLGWFLPIPILHDALHAVAGGGDGGETAPPPDEGTQVDQQWLKDQLARADAAEQRKDYAAAIRIYRQIIDRTGDTSWEQRIKTLREQPVQERQERLQKLRDRLEMAEDLAAQKRYDDALAVLRNIGREDRSLLSSLGIGVDHMESTIQAAKTRQTKVEEQRQELASRLAAAKALREEGKLKEALAAYMAIGETFDAALIPDTVDLAKVTADLKAEIAEAEAGKPPEETTETTGREPEPPPSEAAKAIADLLAQAASLEKAEKFAEALAALEQIKEKFDKKFWPDQLEQRIRQVKAKKEALEFFGME
ncbi:MAG: hypothetical protein R6X20_08595 [Phycisphaerae bacterium]